MKQFAAAVEAYVRIVTGVIAVFLCLAGCATYQKYGDFYFSEIMGDRIVIEGYHGKSSEVDIPPTINKKPVTGIAFYAFAKKKLTSVTIPDSVDTIWGGAFANNRLTSVVIPDNVTHIGQSAFINNRLISVAIPDSVEIIGKSAFENNQLTSVTISDSVTFIGDSAFENNHLVSITISNNIERIEAHAFANNRLTSVTIPGSVTTIAYNAFANNPLTSVTILGSVTDIGENVFGEFQPYIIAHGAGAYTRQGNQILRNGQGIQQTPPVVVAQVNNTPQDVQKIPPAAAQANTAPQDVQKTPPAAAQANNAQAVSGQDMRFGDFMYAAISDGKAVRITGYTGRERMVRIPEKINNLPVTEIGEKAFYEKNLTGVTIPAGISLIGKEAFQGNSIRSITIPGTVRNIGDYAFDHNSITSLNISNGVTRIGTSAFGSNNLFNITIPESVTIIDTVAFWCNPNLSSITINNKRKITIGSGAFIAGMFDFTSSAGKITIGPNAELEGSPSPFGGGFEDLYKKHGAGTYGGD